MVASMRAVAAIWASAALNVHAIIAMFSAGSTAPFPPAREGGTGPEGQPEQEAHMRGADRAEDGGQLLLQGVAQHLAAGGRDREHSPQPGHAAAPPVTARRPRGRQIRPSGEPRNRGPGMSDARRLWADQPSSCQRPSARRQAMPSAFAVAAPMLMVSTMWRQTRPAGSLKDAVGCTMPLSRPVLAAPDVGGAVADLGEGNADGLQGRDLVVLVEEGRGVGLGELRLGRDARRFARICGAGAGCSLRWRRALCGGLVRSKTACEEGDGTADAERYDEGRHTHDRPTHKTGSPASRQPLTSVSEQG